MRYVTVDSLCHAERQASSPDRSATVLALVPPTAAAVCRGAHFGEGPVLAILAMLVRRGGALRVGRVGTRDCSPVPLTEPDVRFTHPALWIGMSELLGLVCQNSSASWADTCGV